MLVHGPCPDIDQAIRHDNPCEHMNDTAPQAADTRPSLSMRAQYIKDLSFENPRAPASLFSLREPPHMDVSLNLAVSQLDEQVFEVAIQTAIRANAEKATIFLCDLVYAGVVELRNIPAEHIEQALYVQAPQLIFPYVRRVISDIARDGGFPGLQLEPIDFLGLYLQQKQGATTSNPA